MKGKISINENSIREYITRDGKNKVELKLKKDSSSNDLSYILYFTSVSESKKVEINNLYKADMAFEEQCFLCKYLT